MSNSSPSQSFSFKQSCGFFLRGIAMGAADVVPGVSGGTIAFITGIYDRFIHSLKSFDIQFIRYLLRWQIDSAWHHVNGNLLLPVLLGIVTAIFSLVRVILYLLEHYPIGIWSYFGGLVMASAFVLMKEFNEYHWRRLFWVFLGTLLVYALTELPATTIPINPVTIFLSGIVAISAMLLPGISGSFILLIFGFYQPTIDAVHKLDFVYLGTFVAGCGVGFIVFSHVIDWLLHRHRDNTLATLIGFLFGSLAAIWPWKEGANYTVGSAKVWPSHYLEAGLDPQFMLAGMTFFLGIVIVLSIEAIVSKLAMKHEKDRQ